jgi:hypothetical protein
VGGRLRPTTIFNGLFGSIVAFMRKALPSGRWFTWLIGRLNELPAAKKCWRR